MKAKARARTTKGRKSAGINKNMSLAEVITSHPETVPVFQRHGLHCIGCAVAAYESVEQGALAHGIDPDALLRDLNQAVKRPAKAAGKKQSR